MKISHTIHLLRSHATLNNGVLLAAALITILGVWNTMTTLQKNFMLQRKLDSIEKQIKITEVEIQTLQLKQQYLKSDEYKELVARESLGRVLPGEKVIMLPPVPEKSPQAPQAAPIAEESNFGLWMKFFFGGRPSGS